MENLLKFILLIVVERPAGITVDSPDAQLAGERPAGITVDSPDAQLESP